MSATAGTRDRSRRMVVAALGVACTALGGLGVFVPGLPTTVFLIAASYLFTRSSPRLDRRLRGSRLLGPYLRRLAESGGGMPRRVKATALVSMWTGIAISSVALWGALALQAATVTLGLVGTATILFRVPTIPSVNLPLAAGAPSIGRGLPARCSRSRPATSCSP